MPTGKNVTFVHNDPLNSEVVDGWSGTRLYNISTPSKLLKQTTTLCDARGEVVGVYKNAWHSEVTYRGQTMELSKWLPRKHLASRSRLLTLPDGKVYEWKQRSMSGSFQLLDADTQAQVAETHSAHLGILHSKRHMAIDVSEALVPFLDAVVLSFIICEAKKREEELSAAQAGAAGAAAV